MRDLTVIIVNWNSWEYASRCLDSLRQTVKKTNYEIILIDNFSSEDRSEEFRQKFSDLSLSVTRNRENLGFAKACNQGLAAAAGRYALLLNPDVVLEEGTLEKSLAYMQSKPQIGVLGCRLLNEDGSLQKWTAGSFLTPATAFNHYFFLSALVPCFFKSFVMTEESETATEVDWVCGAYLMVRREAWQNAGVLSEKFFMYGEDMEWCMRMKKAGWKVVYLPEAAVKHFSGASLAKAPKEKFWRGQYGLGLYMASQGYNVFQVGFFHAMAATGFFLRSLLYSLKGVLTLNKKDLQKASLSIRFSAASFGLLAGKKAS